VAGLLAIPTRWQAGAELLELQAIRWVGRTVPRWPTAEESCEYEYQNLKHLGGSDATPTPNARARLPGAPPARVMSAMAEISSSAADDAPPAPLPVPPAAQGHGGVAADNDDDDDENNNTFSPLLDLLERFPDLFAQKVLRHLDLIDRTFVAQTGGACRAAVAASGLPRAGSSLTVDELGRSVCVVTHKLSDFCTSVERLAWAKASGCPWVELACELRRSGRAPEGAAVGAGARLLVERVYLRSRR